MFFTILPTVELVFYLYATVSEGYSLAFFATVAYNFQWQKEDHALDKRKVIYYEDELNDEFSQAVLERPVIDGNYQYFNDSFFGRISHLFWYRIIAMPLAFAYTKLAFSHKIIGGNAMKPYRKTGCFMYGNHTQDIGDALMPNMIEKKKDKYFIVNPENLNVPIVGKVTKQLGALPLPTGLRAYKNFLAAIKKRIDEGAAIVIYPEAHIWPYYTKIRPFPDTSFVYPVKHAAPVFCFTNTYVKRKFSRRPKIVTYVDGPFFPDSTLPTREAQKKLRDEVYEKMCERSSLSTVRVIEYVKKEIL